MGEKPQSSVLQLAEQLSEGFAVLSGEYQALFDQQKQLESRLSWAKQQYLDLLKRFTPDTLSQEHRTFLQELESVVAEPRPQSDWVDLFAQSEDVERKRHAVLIKQAEAAALSLRSSGEEEDTGVKIWSGPSADKKNVRPLRIRTNSDMSHMEKDFTTSGTPSKLGCPFASASGRGSPLATPRSSTSRMSLRGGRRSQRPSFNDPIRAEICGNDVVCASPSVEGSAANSAAVCPIRFLDQHAPEEVAKYFEKHKHELPRSHEVCISRFQSNQESIEQLDRKYGNLVSMIQGLGEKHQAWLPEEPEEGEEGEEEEAAAPETEPAVDSKKERRVENWAKAVTASLHEDTPGEEEEESPDQAVDETRTAHFDRPLKEVRVGESPSRPWGIHIPAKYTDAESSSSVGSAPTASPPIPLKTDRPIGGDTPYKSGKCPFDHKAMGIGMGLGMGTNKFPDAKESHPIPQPSSLAPQMADPFQAPIPPSEPPLRPQELPTSKSNETTKPAAQAPPHVVPQMIFNGPVFLGYPPEQLAVLLQNSNLGSAMR